MIESNITEIGVIGGSGFCKFPELEESKKIEVSTEFGLPSDFITIGRYSGKTIAFLPRHGYNHQLPPHAIPYMANVLAFKEMGIKNIIAFCVAGSLKKKIKPGDFVIPDQFINFTWGRDNSFKQHNSFVHLPMAEPYSKSLRNIILEEGKNLDLKLHKRGTVMVIQGPRFNTLAESILFSKWGGDIVNMTQYPECYFAREQGLNYAVVAAITDFDVCLQNLGLSMTNEKITENSKVFKENIEKQKRLLSVLLLNWQDYKIKLLENKEDNNISYEDAF